MKANINTELINSFLVVNNLTVDEFCKKAKIDKKIFKKILKGEFSLLSLFKMSEFMKIDLENLVLDKEV